MYTDILLHKIIIFFSPYDCGRSNYVENLRYDPAAYGTSQAEKDRTRRRLLLEIFFTSVGGKIVKFYVQYAKTVFVVALKVGEGHSELETASAATSVELGINLFTTSATTLLVATYRIETPGIATTNITDTTLATSTITTSTAVVTSISTPVIGPMSTSGNRMSNCTISSSDDSTIDSTPFSSISTVTSIPYFIDSVPVRGTWNHKIIILQCWG